MSETNPPRRPIDTSYVVDDKGNRIYLLPAPAKTVEKQQASNGKQLGGVTGKGFLPGQSGNPKGRPKRKTIVEAVYEVLMKTIPAELSAKRPDLQGKLMMELFAEVGVRKAIGGDPRFWIEIARKIDGEKAEGILTAIFNTQNNLNLRADTATMSVEQLRQLREILTGLAGRNGPAA